MKQTADSTNSGVLDMRSITAREQAEAEAFKPRDRRFKVRKERTQLISFRIKPAIRETMERIADAEGIPMVTVLERGIELYDKQLKAK